MVITIITVSDSVHLNRVVMKARFHSLMKNKKKGNCTFFYLASVSLYLRIAGFKLATVRIKSDLPDTNS